MLLLQLFWEHFRIKKIGLRNSTLKTHFVVDWTKLR